MIVFVLSAVIWSCGKHPSPEQVAASSEDEYSPRLEIVSSAVDMEVISESGEKLWALKAHRADATLSREEKRGKLTGVEVTLFQENLPYLRITSEYGWADESEKKFDLRGKVFAETNDKRTKLQCERVFGSADAGNIAASNNVRLIYDGMSLGPADNLKARFSKKKGKLEEGARLEWVTFQGQDVWFSDKARNMVISNVVSGEVRTIQDGKFIEMRAEGKPVRAVWSKEGLTVTAESVHGILEPESTEGGESYRLLSATFQNKVTGQMQTKSARVGVKPTPRTINVKAPKAVYEREKSTLTLTGGVVVRSTHPSVVGVLRAPTISVHFKPDTFEAQRIVASGEDITYSDELSDLEIWGLRRIEIREGETKQTRDIEGEGTPLHLRFPARGFEVSANKVEGTFDAREEAIPAEQRLETARFSGGVSGKLSGSAKDRRGQIRKWTAYLRCSEVLYSKGSRTLTLLGGVEIEGDHPLLGFGGGMASAPKMVVKFKEGTFEPESFRMERAGEKKIAAESSLRLTDVEFQSRISEGEYPFRMVLHFWRELVFAMEFRVLRRYE
ncbi:MAG TPA: LPS export ABC transporter periplasmic protein LptC [Fimbriimonadales bacterium]|nr:LPS export ABC transporter periplasmic protein LptC [Fimbriimonadales bacterium]